MTGTDPRLAELATIIEGRGHGRYGLADINQTLLHPQWLERPEGDDPFVTHDIHRHRRAAVRAES